MTSFATRAIAAAALSVLALSATAAEAKKRSPCRVKVNFDNQISMNMKVMHIRARPIERDGWRVGKIGGPKRVRAGSKRTVDARFRGLGDRYVEVEAMLFRPGDTIGNVFKHKLMYWRFQCEKGKTHTLSAPIRSTYSE